MREGSVRIGLRGQLIQTGILIANITLYYIILLEMI